MKKENKITEIKQEEKEDIYKRLGIERKEGLSWRRIKRFFNKILVKLTLKKEDKEQEWRVNFIRRIVFKWRLRRARNKLLSYKNIMDKLKEVVGNIRDDEKEKMKRLKLEMIKGILMWKDDFKITYINDKGENTNIPVDIEGLSQMDIDNLYETYLYKGTDMLANFIKGKSIEEIQEEI